MKSGSLRIIFALMLVAAFVCGDVSSVMAQDVDDEGFMLEEITVTATKRAENQQKVAVAMETISSDTIKEMGKTDIDQILSGVSSVIINKAADGMRVTLRGMANDQNVFQGMQASTPTVAVNMDGAYTQRNSSGNNLYDIERVEVLYGPQSTMYSTSTPGGIVNVITAAPKLDKFGASATLEAGNYNLKHGEVSLNVPVMDTVAMRVAGSIMDRDGYLSNGAEDEDTQSARLKVLYQPAENFSVTVTGEYSKTGGQGFGGVDLFDDQDDVPDPWQADSTEAKPSNDQVNKKLSGQIAWDNSVGTLTIIPSYTKRDNETTEIRTAGGGPPGTPPDPSQQYETSNWNHLYGDEKSIELRMTSSPDFTAFKWIAGVNYYKSMENVDNTSYRVDNGALDSYGARYQDNESKAVYANITYPFTDEFRGTAGMRYTDESNYSYNLESGRNTDEYGVPQPEIVNMTYSDPDYKIGVEYDLAENSMLYSDISTSYRTQGMAYDEDGNPFDPEKLTALTVGAKNRFFGNRMQVNVSAYYYWYKDYLATTGVDTIQDNYVGISPQTGLQVYANNGVLEYTDVDGDGSFTVGTDIPLDNGQAMDQNAKNTGDARVYGVDLQTTTLITSALKLDLSVSYLKKEFVDMFFDFNNITNALGVADRRLDGEEFTFAPNWTVNGALSYTINMPNGGTLTPSVDTRFQTSYKLYMLDRIASVSSNADGTTSVSITDLSPYINQEAYHISNCAVVYKSPGGMWSLTAYAKNLEDYAVKRSIMIMGGASDMMIGPPRTYGAVASVKF